MGAAGKDEFGPGGCFLGETAPEGKGKGAEFRNIPGRVDPEVEDPAVVPADF